MATTIIFLVVGLLIGGGLGYVLRRTDSRLEKRNQELKKEVEQANQTLQSYKQDVATHFRKTADLVNNMTDSYRSVHEHLAQGANALCSEQLGVEQLDIRQTKLMDKSQPAEAVKSSAKEAPEGPASDINPPLDTNAQSSSPNPESVVVAKNEGDKKSDEQTIH